jgi:photosystem II stability/assembly factor-like uncharacterized protein
VKSDQFINLQSIYGIGLAVLVLLFSGCGKFDRSKIKMPEFNFATSENLHSIAAVDAQHIWVSGNYGTVLSSADKGRTWQEHESGIEELLLGSITFANQNEGWAAGVKGTIVHTSDGGKNWTVQPSNIEYDIHDLYFLDARHGWAVGEYGTAFHTDNGGKKWQSLIEPTDIFYNDVFFVDRMTGWIVGEFGTILHTRDGGITWQNQECPDLAALVAGGDWDRPQPALYGIYFIDKNRGWIVGLDGVIIQTVDGGNTWKKVDSGTDKSLYSVVIKGQKGWIVGNKGAYLMSDDGGNTWDLRENAIKTKFWLREISFVDDLHGLIVGARGTIVLTEDGGENWEIVSGFGYDMEEFGLADF